MYNIYSHVCNVVYRSDFWIIFWVLKPNPMLFLRFGLTLVRKLGKKSKIVIFRKLIFFKIKACIWSFAFAPSPLEAIWLCQGLVMWRRWLRHMTRLLCPWPCNMHMLCHLPMLINCSPESRPGSQTETKDKGVFYPAGRRCYRCRDSSS